MSHCTNRTVLDRISSTERRALQRAEWLAGEYRAQGRHPQAHVHFDITADTYVVVSPQGGASA